MIPVSFPRPATEADPRRADGGGVAKLSAPFDPGLSSDLHVLGL